MMVTAIFQGDENPSRTPLLPAEKDNGVINSKKPKAKHVCSRYMSSSPSMSNSSSVSRRCQSPLVSRNSTSASTITTDHVPKRSVSVDRPRPVASRPGTPNLVTKLSNSGEMSAATKLLVTSTRSLSVSFQGEAFSLPISKTKASPNLNNTRNGTPERRRRSNTPVRGKVEATLKHVENTKPIDQHRWPARIRQENPLSRSLDYSNVERNKLFGSKNVIKALKQSMDDDGRRALINGRLSLDLGKVTSKIFKPIKTTTFDHVASDTESVSTGNNSLIKETTGARARSAHFWQETNTRLRRLQNPGSPISPKFPRSKNIPNDGNSPLSSPRTMSSPIRGNVRPASPGKLMTSSMVSSSPARGIVSPSRVRSSAAGSISSNLNGTPSVLSFAVDVRRGKVGENRIVDVHLLRLLHNRHLQWMYINARAEDTLVVQQHGAQKNIWNAWITISDLRDSVTKKRHRLQLLRQKLKLASILRGQMIFLEDWASLDKDLSLLLIGAIEALKASTLRLPVGEGAIVDIQSMKDAIGSAFDVMQPMTSSIYSHLSRVEEVNTLVAELAKVTAKERAMLQQCKDCLSMLAAKQVKDCSLRTYTLQINHISSI